MAPPGHVAAPPKGSISVGWLWVSFLNMRSQCFVPHVVCVVLRVVLRTMALRSRSRLMSARAILVPGKAGWQRRRHFDVHHDGAGVDLAGNLLVIQLAGLAEGARGHQGDVHEALGFLLHACAVNLVAQVAVVAGRRS